MVEKMEEANNRFEIPADMNTCTTTGSGHRPGLDYSPRRILWRGHRRPGVQIRRESYHHDHGAIADLGDETWFGSGRPHGLWPTLRVLFGLDIHKARKRYRRIQEEIAY